MEPGKKIYINPCILKGIMHRLILGSFAIRVTFLLKLFELLKIVKSTARTEILKLASFSYAPHMKAAGVYTNRQISFLRYAW